MNLPDSSSRDFSEIPSPTIAPTPLPEGLPENLQRSWNQDHWEVMAEWIVWKFYPPDPQLVTELSALQEKLALLHPIIWDEDMIDELNDITSCITKKWIIEDTFPDHKIRRAFFQKSDMMPLDSYCNKLSKTRAIFHYLTMLIPHMRTSLENHDFVILIDKKILDLSNTATRFEDMVFPEKVTFLKEIDSSIIKFLEDMLTLLSTQP